MPACPVSCSMSAAARHGRPPAEERGLHRRLLSFIYYQAIRDLRPVWKLEDMRTMEMFYWDRQQRRRMYSPSEALLYAVVHDHRAYAHYLLTHYSEEALAVPSRCLCSCQAQVPHLAMAVRYGRRDMLEILLRAVHRVPGLRSSSSSSFSLEDGRTPLHLACEPPSLDVMTLLLGHGASPHAEDRLGMTPLDVLLEQLRHGDRRGEAEGQLCLHNMLLFMPRLRFKLRASLETEPPAWTQVLGQHTYSYLTGKRPGPLLVIAMQRLLQLLPPDQFPMSLQELPIPSALKRLPVRYPVLTAGLC